MAIAEILFILTFSNFIFTKGIKLEISKPLEGKIINNPIYYTLDISNLNQEVEISFSPKDNINNFCSGDIYASTKNNSPDSLSNSEYHTINYYEKKIIFKKNPLDNSQKLYIGVNSNEECSFIILADLIVEYEIFGQKENIIEIKKNKDFVAYFWLNSTDERIQIRTVSFALNNYRLTLIRDNYTLEASTSWIGGELIDINKYDHPIFCNNCKYKIIINTQNDDIMIFLNLIFSSLNTLEKIPFHQSHPVSGNANNHSETCYYYEITPELQNEDLIIMPTIFNDKISMKIYLWKLEKDDKFLLKQDILDEGLIKLTAEERNRGQIKTGNVYICIKSYSTKASYFIKMFPLSRIEDFQTFSYLVTGISVPGYLPSKKATRYRILQFSSYSDIEVKMETISGNPKLFGLFIENIYSFRIHGDKINDYKSQFINSTIDYNIQFFNLKSEDNKCQKFYTNITKISYSCAYFAIVYCEGNEECHYNLVDNSQDKFLTLKENKELFNILEFNQTDKFQFSCFDADIDEFLISIDSMSGVLSVVIQKSYNNDFSILYNNTGSNEIVQKPIIVKLTKENNNNLLGTYKITVTARTFAYYNIIYKPIKNNLNKQIMLKSNSVYHGLYDQRNISLFYKNENTQNTPIHFLIYSIQNDFYFEIYGENNELIVGKTSNSYFNSEKLAKGVTLRINVFQNEKLNYYQFLPLNSFYLCVYQEGKPIHLRDGIPIRLRIPNGKNTSFVYPYNYNHELNAVFYTNYQIKISFRLDEIYSEKDLDKSVFISRETIVNTKYIQEECRKRELFPCNIYFNIESFSDFNNIEIHLKEVNNFPWPYKIGTLIKNRNINEKEYHYYSFYINKDLLGKLILVPHSGFFTMVINIFEEKTNNYLPTIDKYLGKVQGSFIDVDLDINETMLKSNNLNCDKLCHVLIGIQLEKNNYTDPFNNFLEGLYSFTYQSKNSVLELRPNEEFKRKIKPDEYQYFKIDVQENTNNFFVIVNNCFGNCTIVLNYGTQSLPTIMSNNWVNFDEVSPSIDINLDDNFFKVNNIKSLRGEYIVGVTSMHNSSYTLSYSVSPKRILNKFIDTDKSCRTKKDDEFCYFDLYLYNSFKGFIDVFEISLDFLYGNGDIYFKIYPEINLNNLPSNNNYDLSSVESNSRNQLIVNLDNIDYERNSFNKSYFIIAVHCIKKCYFDISTTQIQKFVQNSHPYIFQGTSKIFSFIKNQDSFVNILYYTNAAIDIKLLTGAVEGYVEYSFNEKNNSFKLGINNAFEHTINVEKEYNNETYFSLYSKNLVINSLTETSLVKFIFKTKEKYTKISSGQLKKYQVNKFIDNPFYFYFDDDAEVAYLNVKGNSTFEIHTKIIEKNKFNKNSQALDYETSDHQYVSDSYFNNVSIFLANERRTTLKSYVCLIQIRFFLTDDFSDKNINDIEISLVQTVGKNNQIKISPQFPYSSFVRNSLGYYDIFDLRYLSEDDEKMSIEIDSCGEQLGYFVYDKISYFKGYSPNIIYTNQLKNKIVETVDKGKVNIDIYNVNKDLFINVFSKNQTGGTTPYVLKYYFNNYYSFQTDKDLITYAVKNGKLEISWGKIYKISEEDKNSEPINMNPQFYIYTTANEAYYENMNSYCFLSNKHKYMRIDITNQTKFRYDEIEYNKKIFIVVMALYSDYQYYIFNPVEIYVSGNVIRTEYLLVLVVIITILIFIICFLKQKYYSTKEKLDLEIKEAKRETGDSDIIDNNQMKKSDVEMSNQFSKIQAQSGNEVDMKL